MHVHEIISSGLQAREPPEEVVSTKERVDQYSDEFQLTNIGKLYFKQHTIYMY